jgi:hypothetical protein
MDTAAKHLSPRRHELKTKRTLRGAGKGGVRDRLRIYYRKTENYTALNIPKQCPLVLLINNGCRQGKVLGIHKVMGKGLF